MILSGVICLAVLLAAAYAIYHSLPDKTPQQKSLEYKQDLRSGAIAATHRLIEQQLNTVTTAKHPAPGDSAESAAINGSNLYTITSWIDIENLSGAKERKNYLAKVKYLPPNNRWILLNVEFTPGK